MSVEASSKPKGTPLLTDVKLSQADIFNVRPPQGFAYDNDTFHYYELS